MAINILGFTLHLYGLILGIAIWVGIWLAERNAIRKGIDRQTLWSAVWWSLVAGVIGARLWHVMIDWPLYAHNLWEILAIWQGGLSIIGAVIGGVGGLFVFSFLATSGNSHNANEGDSQHKSIILFSNLLDIAALSLPFSQAIGRLGNFVNQELYGWPTTLPWAITIDPAHRLSGFQQYLTYHPLFAYEMILTLSIGIFLTELSRPGSSINKLSKNWKKIFTNSIFLLYIFMYSMGRFMLDFLRIDRSVVWAELGVNQLILLTVWILSAMALRYLKIRENAKN